MDNQIIGFTYNLSSNVAIAFIKCLTAWNYEMVVDHLAVTPMSRVSDWLKGFVKNEAEIRLPQKQIAEFVNICEVMEQLVLYFYSPGVPFSPIDAPKDFPGSNCEFVLLYYDCWWLEMYVKAPEKIQQLTTLLDSMDAKFVEYKTAENDGRIGMQV